MFRDSSDGIEEYITSVTGFINKCIKDVVPTVTTDKSGYPAHQSLHQRGGGEHTRETERGEDPDSGAWKGEKAPEKESSTAIEGPDDRQINRVTQPTKAFTKEEEENTLEKQKEGKIQTVEPGKVKRPQRTPESSTAIEGPDDRQINRVTQPTKAFTKEEENTLEKQKEGKIQTVEPGKVKRPQRTSESSRGQQNAAWVTDLSKEDFLRLLGVMEGEVQAREDIIHMLKSERTKPEALEAHYGSAAPIKPLQALQRDSLLTNNTSTLGDDVYQMPMQELDRLEDKHRETYRRMLEQLLLAEKCHRRTVNELDNEKRKHTDFMNKSDDFTNLLEQERER
ncbi:filamin-A-interacting protein 1-like [Oncorhynchus nerka]|uniref:filamin-A-interacting protein 1-like n=1 Tax=Oncorhynchus nerka TaxID=8023 RepID=UPI0031B843EA